MFFFFFWSCVAPNIWAKIAFSKYRIFIATWQPCMCRNLSSEISSLFFMFLSFFLVKLSFFSLKVLLEIVERYPKFWFFYLTHMSRVKWSSTLKVTVMDSRNLTPAYSLRSQGSYLATTVEWLLSIIQYGVNQATYQLVSVSHLAEFFWSFHWRPLYISFLPSVYLSLSLKT